MTNFLNIPIINGSENPNPKHATEGSAGVDLYSGVGLTLNPGETKVISTKLKMAIPEGYVGLLCSRSGLAADKNIFVLNAPGIIDSDFRGEVGVILANFGTESFEIEIGDRIAQMVFVKHEKVNFIDEDVLDETKRGDKGYGSTGIHK